MICEHCGSKVVDGGHICTVCGMSLGPEQPRPRQMAKVIPFRAKKRIAERPSAKIRRRSSPAVWWIVLIVAIALVAPYLLPLAR
ncbi:MAG: hypothetical protein M0Z36_03035 [Thermaerobacter sp.]|nr:hypothetical protein [Thermaerobacter sp.]